MTHDEEFWNDWLKLQEDHITYNDDGSIDYHGNVYIMDNNITKIIPKFNKVKGCFFITSSKLESLKNSPKIIIGTKKYYGNLSFLCDSLKSFDYLNVDGIENNIFCNDEKVDKQIIKTIQNNNIKWLTLNVKNHNYSGYEIISQYLKGELFV